MKIAKTIVLLMALLIANPFGAAAEPTGTVKGSTKRSTKTIELNIEQITSLEVCTAIDVVVVEGEANQIEVELNDNLWEYLYIITQGDKLSIYLENGRGNGFSSIDATVKVPYNARLSSFEASTASSIISEVDIIAPELKISADAASRVELSAVVKGDCRVEVDAASRVDLIAKIGGRCLVDVDAASRADLTISASELHTSIEAASKVVAEGWVDILRVDAEAMSRFSGDKLRCGEGQLSAEAMSKITYSSTGEGKFKTSKEALSSIKKVK